MQKHYQMSVHLSKNIWMVKFKSGLIIINVYLTSFMLACIRTLFFFLYFFKMFTLIRGAFNNFKYDLHNLFIFLYICLKFRQNHETDISHLLLYSNIGCYIMFWFYHHHSNEEIDQVAHLQKLVHYLILVSLFL